MRAPLHLFLRTLALAVLLAVNGGAHALAQQSATSVEKLLEQGWEVAGYVAAWENRSLILFRHKDHKYLVQCSVLIDVLRTPRMVTYCYEISRSSPALPFVLLLFLTPSGNSVVDTPKRLRHCIS